MLHKRQQHIVDIYGKLPETLDELGEACIAVISHGNAPVKGFAWNIHFENAVGNSHHAPIGVKSTMCSRDKDVVRSHPGFYGRVWIRYEESGTFRYSSENFSKTLTYTGSGGGGSYEGLWQPISAAEYRTQRRRIPGDYRTKIVHAYPEPKCFSWDYRLFLMDFPTIERELIARKKAHDLEEDKKELWAKLNNKYYSRMKYTEVHKFEWEDPILKAADEKFLAEYHESLEQEEVSA